MKIFTVGIVSFQKQYLPQATCVFEFIYVFTVLKVNLLTSTHVGEVGRAAAVATTHPADYTSTHLTTQNTHINSLYTR